MSGKKSISSVRDYIDLPFKDTKHQPGLSFDFGCSVIKIIYRPKDGTEAKLHKPPVAKGYERIRFAWFSKENFREALKFIEDHCLIRRSRGTETCIYVTGAGANSNGKEIAERLNLKLITLPEGDCFIKAFNYVVKTFPKSQVIDPPDEIGKREGQQYVDGIMNMMKKAEENNINDLGLEIERPKSQEEALDDSSALPLSEEMTDMFPCIFMILGSGFGILKVEADGSCEVLEIVHCGGRSFLGLGNILTDTKSYEDLIRLAELGTDKTVSQYTSDLFGEEAEAVDKEAEVNAYSLHDDSSDFLCFHFGKTCFKTLDNFKPEDIARGNVCQFAMEVSQKAHLGALSIDAKHVFYAGNFPNPRVIRREMTKANIMRSLMPVSNGHPSVNFHFMTLGGHLGALGAFLHQPKSKQMQSSLETVTL